ncbi:MAG TPA: sarcosine oxidase subunit alpha family protein [Steroidobacteraceae bacterium]|nr:sarcosine oxidase subunit alpha family protein [Steroidobacteraceae bacterium]
MASRPPGAVAAGYRLPAGGRIDRSRPLSFRWNGTSLPAFSGDTVASALLANGVRVVGRSMKFHRPRGILAAGVEEPNALVTIGAGAELQASVCATVLPVHQGLEVRAQNGWPSVDFDIGRTLDALSPLFPAGFYNKTFIWPSWHFYERFIRSVAGLGPAPRLPDPARYEAVNAHCELLVVGGGPAGLFAALAAGRAGIRVILAEQDFEIGGELLGSTTMIDGQPAMAWVERSTGELRSLPNVTLLKATTAFGLYDHGTAGLLQRLDLDHAAPILRQRYWRVRAQQTLLATGAIEQPLVFEQNDRPGIMLAAAVRHHAIRYAASAGRRIVFATNNDSAYLAALDLAAAGVDVPLLADSRSSVPATLAQALEARGIEVCAGTVVLKSSGGPSLRGLQIAKLAGNGPPADIREIACDALGMSGGWAPAVHLYSQARGQLDFDAAGQCFVPRAGSAPLLCAGSVTGAASLAETLASAANAANLAITQAGRHQPDLGLLPAIDEPPVSAAVGATRRTRYGRRRRQWLDWQHDVTVADVELALSEGYENIEHLKRYTTAGMAIDQGKTSNLNTLLTTAELGGASAGDTGTTTYRPPYTPVTLGALAARQTGERYAPRRLLPAHAEHEAQGAHWWEAGGWLRPACYPRPGESMQQAIRREALAVRNAVGIYDASPLGKIEVTGRDAARFLDRFYINNVLTLEQGRTRYGLMLNEQGVIIDDGTIARLGPDRFVVTTTSGGAERIARWLEEWRQCEWPDHEVFTTPVTTQWATVALSGPHARDLLARLQPDIAIDRDSFPHMHVREGRIAGAPARIHRVSFSGEFGFEVSVPANCGTALWRALASAGADLGVTPFGIETLLLLRLEKGFLHVGVDTDGTTCPADVGWGDVALRKQADFIGKRSLMRSDNQRSDRLQLVGLSANDPEVLVPGAHLRLPGRSEGSDGWVTSAAMSPALGRSIALAMLRGGRARLGASLTVHDLDRRCTASVVQTPFYDPQGTRLHV